MAAMKKVIITVYTDDDITSTALNADASFYSFEKKVKKAIGECFSKQMGLHIDVM